MNILTSIKNFLQFINNHWTEIVIVIGLLIATSRKVLKYRNKSNDEKVEIAKKKVKEAMLKLVTEAEMDYMEWVNAGAIKRSQVIDKIFEMFPILSTVANHDELIIWIDEVINEALDIMRNIFEENKGQANGMQNVEMELAPPPLLGNEN